MVLFGADCPPAHETLVYELFLRIQDLILMRNPATLLAWKVWNSP